MRTFLDLIQDKIGWEYQLVREGGMKEMRKVKVEEKTLLMAMAGHGIIIAEAQQIGVQ